MKKALAKFLKFIRRPLNSLLTVLHLNTPARIVIALSPLFVSASGLLMTEAAKLGIHRLNPLELMSLFVTGSTLAAGKLLLWLHGASRAEQIMLATPPAITRDGDATTVTFHDIGTTE